MPKQGLLNVKPVIDINRRGIQEVARVALPVGEKKHFPFETKKFGNCINDMKIEELFQRKRLPPFLSRLSLTSDAEFFLDLFFFSRHRTIAIGTIYTSIATD